jgi:hypothetical protein
VQITTYGKRAYPSVKTLETAMGWSRAKTFRVLDDLKVLGCLLDATDAKGRKYTGEHGSRVRSVDTDALPAPGSSRWLAVKDVLTSDGSPLLVRFVNRIGVSIGETNSEQESQLEIQQSHIESRSLMYGETRKNRLKELRKEQTPTPKEETQAGKGPDSDVTEPGKQELFDKMLAVIERFPLPDGVRNGLGESGVREHIAEAESALGAELALRSWEAFIEMRDFSGFPKKWTAWKAFLKEVDTEWLAHGRRRVQEAAMRNHELTPEQVEAERLRLVAMYGDLDLKYYIQKLKEAKGDWEQNHMLFDEDTRKQMLENIEELKQKVAEFKAKADS